MCIRCDSPPYSITINIETKWIQNAVKPDNNQKEKKKNFPELKTMNSNPTLFDI